MSGWYLYPVSAAAVVSLVFGQVESTHNFSRLYQGCYRLSTIRYLKKKVKPFCLFVLSSEMINSSSLCLISNRRCIITSYIKCFRANLFQKSHYSLFPIFITPRLCAMSVIRRTFYQVAQFLLADKYWMLSFSNLCCVPVPWYGTLLMNPLLSLLIKVMSRNVKIDL